MVAHVWIWFERDSEGKWKNRMRVQEGRDFDRMYREQGRMIQVQEGSGLLSSGFPPC